ncbi:GNAT family N-acetyltransferase [Mucilaginibacter segetis]|uniref:GNAT family N-acetyltransferase n=1 Tax=Mucilaginibacter segetis TaxID=2793071 RepID=A0A934UN83_9SPHI|nr:GNAT family N-acetyltransferase [Mucilaginibacter segetis]MBK0379642.1 GNAT family N-acetyltransferase [Mucilaginibacter segetis]
MEHLLDNPAWSALTSNNKNLSNGNAHARYFDKEVSPIVGLIENTEENLLELYNLIPDDSPKLFVSKDEMQIPQPWEVLNYIPGYQMVHETQTPLTESGLAISPLNEMHIPQMLALTKLTKPGPFATRTIEFGHYSGIFEAGQLAAMAGQRMHAYNYAEVSAVCTHPDHTGKGYARQLLIQHINRILANGEIPFLHVRDDNDRAIKVYQRLGFVIRTRVNFYFIKK